MLTSGWMLYFCRESSEASFHSIRDKRFPFLPSFSDYSYSHSSVRVVYVVVRFVEKMTTQRVVRRALLSSSMSRALFQAPQKPTTHPHHRRGLRTSSAARGNPNDPEYVHAKHMYDVRGFSSNGFVYGSAILAVLIGGVSIPVFAVRFQNAKLDG